MRQLIAVFLVAVSFPLVLMGMSGLAGFILTIIPAALTGKDLFASAVLLLLGAVGLGLGLAGFYAADRMYFDRFARSCCQKCGYDLRGSPGPRCPECGAER